MKSKDRRQTMRHIATVALMLNLGVAGVYAQQRPVKMTFSGTLGLSPFNILPDTVTDEQVVAGDGALGPFTFRELHADKASPQPSSSCSPGPYFPTVVGAGVFRFQDGSLLTVTVTEGAICIDLSANMAHLTESYQITGGTGRFKDASGTLTLTATLIPVLRNASVVVPINTNTGEFEGTVSGPAIGEDGQDARR
jgi:hypothetical protein